MLNNNLYLYLISISILTALISLLIFRLIIIFIRIELDIFQNKKKKIVMGFIAFSILFLLSYSLWEKPVTDIYKEQAFRKTIEFAEVKITQSQYSQSIKQLKSLEYELDENSYPDDLVFDYNYNIGLSYMKIYQKNGNIDDLKNSYDYFLRCVELKTDSEKYINSNKELLEIARRITNLTGDKSYLIRALDSIIMNNGDIDNFQNEIAMSYYVLSLYESPISNLKKAESYLGKNLDKNDKLLHSSILEKISYYLKTTVDVNKSIEMLKNELAKIDKSVDKKEYANINFLLADSIAVLSKITFGNNNYEKSIDHYRRALEFYKIETYPLKYAGLNLSLAELYLNFSKEYKNQKYLDEVIDRLDNASRIYEENNYPVKYANILILESQFYREKMKYEKIDSLEQKAQESEEKVSKIADSVENEFLKNNLNEMIVKSSLEFSYIYFLSYEKRIQILDQGIDKIDMSIDFYNSVSNAFMQNKSIILKTELSYRKMYLMHLNYGHKSYDNKLAIYNDSLELLNKLLNKKDLKEVARAEALFLKSRILKECWVLNYKNANEIGLSNEKSNENYKKATILMDEALKILESNYNEKFYIEMKVEQLNLYNGNINKFAAKEREIYIKKGLNLIQFLDSKISYSKSPDTFIDYYDYCGFFFNILANKSNNENKKEEYLMKSLDYLLEANKRIDVLNDPNNKLRILKRIIKSLDDIYSLNKNMKYQQEIEQYKSELLKIENLY